MIEEEWPMPEKENKFDWSLPMKAIHNQYGLIKSVPIEKIDISKNKVIPKVPWTLEQFKNKIETTDEDIKTHNQELNNIQSKMNSLFEQKKQVCQAVAKKWAYRKLLVANIQEYFPESK